MKVESMSLTESIISYTNDNSKAQQKVEEECSVLKYTKSIAVGVVILVAGYSVFFLIISHSAGLENDETTGQKISPTIIIHKSIDNFDYLSWNTWYQLDLGHPHLWS